MIIEMAEIQIKNANQAEKFEAAVKQGVEEFVKPTDGFVDYVLRRSIEEPTRYLLMIQWETLEAHMVNFRESANFTKWRAVVGVYFAKAPQVQHYELC